MFCLFVVKRKKLFFIYNIKKYINLSYIFFRFKKFIFYYSFNFKNWFFSSYSLGFFSLQPFSLVTTMTIIFNIFFIRWLFSSINKKETIERYISFFVEKKMKMCFLSLLILFVEEKDNWKEKNGRNSGYHRRKENLNNIKKKITFQN